MLIFSSYTPCHVQESKDGAKMLLRMMNLEVKTRHVNFGRFGGKVSGLEDFRRFSRVLFFSFPQSRDCIFVVSTALGELWT